MSNNTTEIAYINNKGITQSIFQYDFNFHIWESAWLHHVEIIAAHIPGV